MTKRVVGKATVRKGVRITNGKAKVVTTRKPKGLMAKAINAALKAAGK